MEIISSVALPKVKLSNPPIVSFVCMASCSVTKLMRSANGARESKLKTKVTSSGPPAAYDAIEIGTQSSKTFSGLPNAISRTVLRKVCCEVFKIGPSPPSSSSCAFAVFSLLSISNLSTH